MTPCFAHTANPQGQWQGLADHLNGVATLAQQFARAASAAESSADGEALAHAAYWAGQLHDVGKYRPAFQAYLRKERARSTDTHHAIYGAAIAYQRDAHDLAFAIAGHHAGLHDLDELQNAIEGKKYPDLVQIPALVHAFEQQGPTIPQTWSPPPVVAGDDPFAAEFYIRFLFSLLVDADFLDTDAHYQAPRPTLALDAAALLARLLAHKAIQPTDGPLNAIRHGIFDRCLQAAAHPPGFFSLTVPTGGGKTLSSMAFALQHAALHGKRRVIVVIPYLSIIEQNAAVYRQLLDPDHQGLVIEHHSATASVADADERRSEDPSARSIHEYTAENWDAPVVVTTAVQFIESLFANRPAACRKLHNVANAVVIFDEVQTFPVHLLNPFLNVLRELRQQYGTTLLFCTATQPAFAHREQGLSQGFRPREIIEINSEKAAHFAALNRVTFQFPPAMNGVDWPELAVQILEQPQALCVVNTRRQAFELWEALKKALAARAEIATDDHDGDGLFHLSSALCAQHRFDRLGALPDPAPGSIRARLAAGKPCWLVSTQLIEAGVDVDFPRVFRALGPLDSLVQAAGRCNREGRLRDHQGQPCLGRVTLFQPAEARLPSGIYRRATELAQQMMETHDLATLGAQADLFADYFGRLYETSATDVNLQAEREKLHFRQVAALARVIPDTPCPLLVPYGGAIEYIADIRNRAVESGKPRFTRNDLRALQRFTVNVPPNDFHQLRAHGVLTPLLPNLELWVLDSGDYHKQLGVLINHRPTEDFVF